MLNRKGAETMSETKPVHPHANHRDRVRNLFLQSGLNGFSDHNVLELLLFYTKPQGDTNVTAHALIDRFGSLAAVLDAPVEELVKVPGIGQYSAVFLKILPQLARRYSCAQTSERFSFTDRDLLREYVRTQFIGEKNECVLLLSFDAAGKFLQCSRLNSGSVTHLQVDKRQLMETALRTGAVYAALAHNHPGGVPAPSASDVRATQEVAALFSGVNIRLVDHLIAAGAECFSMATQPRFQPLFL